MQLLRRRMQDVRFADDVAEEPLGVKDTLRYKLSSDTDKPCETNSVRVSHHVDNTASASVLIPILRPPLPYWRLKCQASNPLASQHP